MNLKNRIILEDYRKSRVDFLALEKVVCDELNNIVKESNIDVLGIEHRIKSEESLVGKLERNGDLYQTFEEIPDILGVRIICFFNDEVDRLGKMIEERFEVDRKNSSDKRALIKANSFGYVSLHYVCKLPRDAGYSDNINEKSFEIQIRTILQHTLAAINHDLGYKSEFGVPREYTRDLSRIAGLLELADDEFMRVRDGINGYTKDIRQKISDNKADDVLINMISLAEYVSSNKRMRSLLEEIAKISNAEIKYINPDSYVEQLAWFGVKTLGALQNMLDKNFDLAYILAKKSLSASDLDIVSTNVGLRFLCRAQLINGGYTEEEMTEFLTLSVGNEERAKRQAKRLLAQNKNNI